MSRSINCHCEDYPCCGCGEEPSQDSQHEAFEAMHGGLGLEEVNAMYEAREFNNALNEPFQGDENRRDTPMGDDYGGE